MTDRAARIEALEWALREAEKLDMENADISWPRKSATLRAMLDELRAPAPADSKCPHGCENGEIEVWDAPAPDGVYHYEPCPIHFQAPAPARDDVALREALQAQFRYTMPDGTPCNCDAFLFADEFPNHGHGKACLLGRAALSTKAPAGDAEGSKP
jgi:hypothetical protein